MFNILNDISILLTDNFLKVITCWNIIYKCFSNGLIKIKLNWLININEVSSVAFISNDEMNLIIFRDKI